MRNVYGAPCSLSFVTDLVTHQQLLSNVKQVPDMEETFLCYKCFNFSPETPLHHWPHAIIYPEGGGWTLCLQPPTKIVQFPKLNSHFVLYSLEGGEKPLRPNKNTFRGCCYCCSRGVCLFPVWLLKELIFSNCTSVPYSLISFLRLTIPRVFVARSAFSVIWHSISNQDTTQSQ